MLSHFLHCPDGHAPATITQVQRLTEGFVHAFRAAWDLMRGLPRFTLLWARATIFSAAARGTFSAGVSIGPPFSRVQSDRGIPSLRLSPRRSSLSPSLALGLAQVPGFSLSKSPVASGLSVGCR